MNSNEYYSCPGGICEKRNICLRFMAFCKPPFFSEPPLKDNGKCHFFDKLPEDYNLNQLDYEE